LISFQTKK